MLPCSAQDLVFPTRSSPFPSLLGPAQGVPLALLGGKTGCHEQREGVAAKLLAERARECLGTADESGLGCR